MTVKFFWRCEAQALSNTPIDDFGAGDAACTLINSGAINTTAVRVGTNGLYRPASLAGGAVWDVASNGYFPGTITAPADSVGSAAFSIFWVTAAYGTQGSTVGFKYQGTVANDNMGIRTSTGGTNLLFSIQNATGGTLNLATTGAAISAGNWYGVVFRWDFPNNKRKLEIYNSSNTLVDSIEDTSTSVSAFIPADVKTASGMVLGQAPASHANDVYFDNYFVADSYAEPLQNNLTIASFSSYSSGTGNAARARFFYMLRNSN